MRIFWHFNELEKGAPPLLAPLLLFSSELNIWAPSGHLLEQAYSKGQCQISPGDFLELVRNRFIRVTAREDWLKNGDSRRNHPWPGAKWIEGFDDQLLRVYEDDYSSPIPSALTQT